VRLLYPSSILRLSREIIESIESRSSTDNPPHTRETISTTFHLAWNKCLSRVTRWSRRIHSPVPLTPHNSRIRRTRCIASRLTSPASIYRRTDLSIQDKRPSSSGCQRIDMRSASSEVDRGSDEASRDKSVLADQTDHFRSVRSDDPSSIPWRTWTIPRADRGSSRGATKSVYDDFIHSWSDCSDVH
jgi:hypothetical protein